MSLLPILPPKNRAQKHHFFRLHRDTPSGVSYHLTSQTATLQTAEKHLSYAQITPLKNPLFIFLTMKKYFPNDEKKYLENDDINYINFINYITSVNIHAYKSK